MKAESRIKGFITYMNNRGISAEQRDTMICLNNKVYIDVYYAYRGRKAFDQLITELKQNNESFAIV